MDYLTGIILFVIGFSAAVLAGRSLRFRRGRTEIREFRREGGGVRLDLVGKRGRQRGENGAATRDSVTRETVGDRTEPGPRADATEPARRTPRDPARNRRTRK